MTGITARLRSFAASRLKAMRQRRDPFDRFQDSVLPSTWSEHDSILDWAIGRARDESIQQGDNSDDPIVARGKKLRGECDGRFRGRCASLGGKLRIAIQVPDFAMSPGGYSLFSNLVAAMNFIGIPAQAFRWSDSTATVFERFRPTCLMTSDHESYLGRIDWKFVSGWKTEHGLLVGLTASPVENAGAPLKERLSWARRNGIDFYYSFHASEYVKTQREYQPFLSEGFRIFSVEFGANPALYFPVDQAVKDLDYVLLASSNPDKHERYFSYLPPILHAYRGFIDGPGWKGVTRFAPAPAHKYLYARAKVGLNLHIAASVESANELNERTYILAACGIPQLVDGARLLGSRFGPECFFVASTPREYRELFQAILRDPSAARKRAGTALEEVFARHTTYHRAEGLATELAACLARAIC